MFRKISLLVPLFFILTSCLSTPGNTLADWKLATDTERLVNTIAASKTPGCQSAQTINTQVTDTSKLQSNASWTEIWTSEACGIRWNIPVVFTGDGQGGTYMMIKTDEVHQAP